MCSRVAANPACNSHGYTLPYLNVDGVQAIHELAHHLQAVLEIFVLLRSYLYILRHEEC